MTDEAKIAVAESAEQSSLAPGPVLVSAKQEQNDFPFSVSVGSVYEGPLDLLLDLIRKQDVDIYDIPIARITAQYLAYVEKLREMDVNVAAESHQVKDAVAPRSGGGFRSR
jgi:segregation and condensation protein A